MNREQAKQSLPIIQAFADGADVQREGQLAKCWYDDDDPSFSASHRWRIKPKPLEGWFVVDRDNAVRLSGEMFGDEKSATDAMDGFETAYGPLRIVHMVEVTK